MTKGKGFLQMHSVSGVGGGFSHNLDYELNTHNLIKETDYGKQEEAKEESKHSGQAISTDKSGHVHIFDHGRELACNDNYSNRSEYARDIDERT
jgi:hypothetical protein